MDIFDETENNPNSRNVNTRKIAIIAIFAVLFVISIYVQIPNFTSTRQIIYYISANLFGFQISCISSLIAQLLDFNSTNPVFIFAGFISPFIYASVLASGRNITNYFSKMTGKDPKIIRRLVEPILFIAVLYIVATFFLVYFLLMMNVFRFLPSTGSLMSDLKTYSIFFYSSCTFKIIYLPLNIVIIEAIRKAFNRVYFNDFVRG